MRRLLLKMWVLLVVRTVCSAALLQACVCGGSREEIQDILAELRNPCPWDHSLDDDRALEC